MVLQSITFRTLPRKISHVVAFICLVIITLISCLRYSAYMKININMKCSHAISMGEGAQPAEKTLKAFNPPNSFHVIPKHSSSNLTVKSMTSQFIRHILSINKSDMGNGLQKTQASKRRDLKQTKPIVIYNYCMSKGAKLSAH